MHLYDYMITIAYLLTWLNYVSYFHHVADVYFFSNVGHKTKSLEYENSKPKRKENIKNHMTFVFFSIFQTAKG